MSDYQQSERVAVVAGLNLRDVGDAIARARAEPNRLTYATSGPGGATLLTDMPPELGGSGDQVTPGWLMRAGLASKPAGGY